MPTIRVIPKSKFPEFVPVIRLSHNVDVSPEFREKCNRLYGELFGMKRAFVWYNSAIFAHPTTAQLIVDSGDELIAAEQLAIEEMADYGITYGVRA